MEWRDLIIAFMFCATIGVYMCKEMAREFVIKPARRRAQSKLLLERVLAGIFTTHNIEGWVFFRLEMLEVGDVYRKYMVNLPVRRKVDIVDQLLKNASERSHEKDMPSALMVMHEAEIETLASICCAGQSFHSVEEIRRALPDAIITFRLSNPLPTP